MRKISSILLCIIFLFSFSTQTKAANVEINYATLGTVIRIIDGDAIWVSLKGMSQNTAYVRFIGVESNGNKDSLDFLTSYLLGKTVVIVPEINGKVPRLSGRYNFAYVFITDKDTLDTQGLEMINDTVLLKGRAKLNEDHKGSRYYKQFQEAQSIARARSIGVWTAVEGLPVSNNTNTTTTTNTNNAININTATQQTLLSLFSDVSPSLINNIINYRETNPFNTVSEIKFVEGMTSEIYDKYASELCVTTNINAASEKELLSLGYIMQSEVNAIVNYRLTSNFFDKSELASRLLISSGLYSTIREYVSTTDVYHFTYAYPSTIVNMNTATVKQLKEVGLSEAQAQAIVTGRLSGAYRYKTLMELSQYAAFSSSTVNLNRYEDNLTLYTDLNSATKKEIASLFEDNFSSSTIDKIIAQRPYARVDDLISLLGETRVDSIKPFVYFDSLPTYEYVNIAAASTEQLIEAGFSASNAELLQKATITKAQDIPVDTRELAGAISIYTNINTATGAELLSLSPKMNGTIVNAIALYRSAQPFGSLSEVQRFFNARGILDVFAEVGKYIVVR